MNSVFNPKARAPYMGAILIEHFQQYLSNRPARKRRLNPYHLYIYEPAFTIALIRDTSTDPHRGEDLSPYDKYLGYPLMVNQGLSSSLEPTYYVMDGCHRTSRALQLGLSTLPAIIWLPTFDYQGQSI